jgi:hypothetical protein
MSHRPITVRALIALAIVTVVAAAAGPAAARPHVAHGGGNSPSGTWKRVLTQAEIDRTASFRVEPEGWATPLPGPVMLAVAQGSFTFSDETGFAIGQTIRVGGDGAFGVLTYVAPYEGAFCPADVPQNASYTWKLDGGSLVLTAVDDRCADRNSILVGTWTHASVTRTLVAKQTSSKTSAKGAVFSERLSEGGKAVGSDSGVCKTISSSISDCRIVVRLRDGTILVHGKLSEARTLKMTITGGTGAYAGARGSVVTKRRSAKVAELTLKIA